MTNKDLLITDEPGVRALLERARRIAVLGIKPENRVDRPAFYVPEYLHSVGYEIVPVPVYYPEVRSILGLPVYRTVSEIPGFLDIVNVFRRPEHILPHIPDIIAKGPTAVWFQSGIRNDEAAGRLIAAGILVVQDRCMMADHQRLGVVGPGPSA